MTRLRHRKRLPCWAIADAPVWYTTPSGARVPAIIDRHPWIAIGGDTWMTRLRDVRVPGAGGLMTINAVELADLTARIEDLTP